MNLVPEPLLVDIDKIQARIAQYEAGEQVSYYLPFYSAGSLPPFTASNGIAFITSVTDTANIVKFGYRVNIAGTSNSSNYWVISSTDTNGDSLSSVDTKLIGSNVWAYIDDPLPIARLDSAIPGFYVGVTKFGSPGPLYIHPLMIATI